SNGGRDVSAQLEAQGDRRRDRDGRPTQISEAPEMRSRTGLLVWETGSSRSNQSDSPGQVSARGSIRHVILFASDIGECFRVSVASPKQTDLVCEGWSRSYASDEHIESAALFPVRSESYEAPIFRNGWLRHCPIACGVCLLIDSRACV